MQFREPELRVRRAQGFQRGPVLGLAQSGQLEADGSDVQTDVDAHKSVGAPFQQFEGAGWGFQPIGPEWLINAADRSRDGVEWDAGNAYIGSLLVRNSVTPSRIAITFTVVKK
jgi:hypothetical protein